MKSLIALSALILAAGCATQEPNTRYARNECKIAPITTATVAGGKGRPATSLERREAEMALASSEYRFRQLRDYGYAGNNIEEALADCNR